MAEAVPREVEELEGILAKTKVPTREKAPENTIYMLTNGDLRDSANADCWPEQVKMMKELTAAFEERGYKVVMTHEFNKELNHGFINSQKMGNDVIRSIPEGATVVVAESTWQYSHHILGALVDREDLNILTAANWSGIHPGLVGQANLNASLTKHGRRYATVWTESFSDELFQEQLDEFLTTGTITHDTSHIHDFTAVVSETTRTDYKLAMEIGERHAAILKYDRAIILPLDEMCMGMENGVFGNELLYRKGMGKECASQSELVARMGLIKDPTGMKARLLEEMNQRTKDITDDEGWAIIDWCIQKGMTINYVDDIDKEIDVETAKKNLTKSQLIEQGKMYIATVRIADKYGAEVVGIQYQQGLKDCCPASDLVEGLLNNPERPDVYDDSGNIIRPGEAIPCFNEVDQGCAVDLVMSNRIWKAFGEDPSANQEDVRWSRKYSGTVTTTHGNLELNEEIWVELLSGSSPASHFEDGYASSSSERQPASYFPLGGGTLKGVGKKGEVVVSRVYQNADGELCMNLMRGGVCELPEEETQDRLEKTTPQWPIKHLIRYGVSRENMILHPSNHETILYASSAEKANQLMFAKAAMAKKLGMKVEIWGDYDVANSLEGRAKAANKEA